MCISSTVRTKIREEGREKKRRAFGYVCVCVLMFVVGGDGTWWKGHILHNAHYRKHTECLSVVMVVVVVVVWKGFWLLNDAVRATIVYLLLLYNVRV